MLKNHFKTAWRNLKKNTAFSAINIFGLAVGLTVCMLIMVYVEHESSYDKFHINANRICWVQAKLRIGNDSIFIPALSYMSGPVVKQGDPMVESYLRFKQEGRNTLIQNPQSASLKFTENKFIFADSNFFTFFSFKLLQGSKQTVLQNPFTIVLSQKAAEKYFGKENPVGKTIRYNNKYNFTVTGVSEKTPSNSSIEYDFVASMASLHAIAEQQGQLKSQNVYAGSFTTYFLLSRLADVHHLETRITKLSATTGSDNNGNSTAFIVTPLTSTHLNANYADASNTKYLKIFPFVAALILLLALINYMSLSTARSTARAKEIGVRKAMGAGRRSIAVQFFIESALFTSISFVIGYFLCVIFQPVFFNFLGIDIDNTFLHDPVMIISFLVLFVVTLILAATYPSMLLSAYRPVAVLYGRLSKQSGGISVRRFFTVFQFTISVVLIICGIVIDRQMYFFKHADTGVRRDNVIMVPFAASIGGHYSAFKRDMQSIAAVKQVSTAHYAMYKGYDIFSVKPKNSNQDVTLPVLTVDQNFIPLLGLQWKIPPADSLYYRREKVAILNEAAVVKLNFGNTPLREKVDSQYAVAGVLKNFNFSSLQSKIQALCLFVGRDNDTASAWGQLGGCIFAKIEPNANTASVIANMKSVYDKYDTEKPFEYYFMDDAYNAMYKAEDKLSKIFSVFTVFTILIAALGLFGLTAFMAAQRTKEIGIRKVLGATVGGITVLLSKDFIKLVLLAVVIASPVAWWAMSKWLQDFAYRINIGWWMFAAAGLLAVIIALATISYQAIKAAVANPVKSLRSE